MFKLPLHFPAEWLWRISSSKSPRNHFGNCTAHFGRANCTAIDNRHRWHQSTATDSNRCRPAIVPISKTRAAALWLTSVTRKSLGKSVKKKNEFKIISKLLFSRLSIHLRHTVGIFPEQTLLVLSSYPHSTPLYHHY